MDGGGLLLGGSKGRRLSAWRARTLGLWCAVLSAYAFAGCKGESTTSGGPGNGSGASATTATPSAPVAAADFSQTFALDFCKIGPCCQNAGFSFGPKSCEDTVKTIMDAAIQARLSEPGVVFDATAAGACADAYRALVVACNDQSLEDAANTACQNVFRGTVPEGGACMNDDACAPVPGVEYMECDNGICTRGDVGVTDIRAALGEPCSETCETDNSGGSGCQTSGSANPSQSAAGACFKNDGLYCNDAFVCAALPKLGERCPEYLCEADTYCNGSICVAGIATGPCPDYDECLHTSYCDDTTQMCTPLKANGTTCNYDGECSSGTCVNDVCSQFSIASPQSCAGLIGE
jgi:hypothetical protein